MFIGTKRGCSLEWLNLLALLLSVGTACLAVRQQLDVRLI
jgi:hypothetical protein